MVLSNISFSSSYLCPNTSQGTGCKPGWYTGSSKKHSSSSMDSIDSTLDEAIPGSKHGPGSSREKGSSSSHCCSCQPQSVMGSGGDDIGSISGNSSHSRDSSSDQGSRSIDDVGGGSTDKVGSRLNNISSD